MAEAADFHSELSVIRDKLSGVETETRITKHDLKNMQQVQHSLASSLEKLETNIFQRLDKLSELVAAQNVKQEKSLGFFAGIAFILTTSGGLLLLLWNLLSNHQ